MSNGLNFLSIRLLGKRTVFSEGLMARYVRSVLMASSQVLENWFVYGTLIIGLQP